MLAREALQTMLDEGFSLEEIGRRVGRHPSTVSYWLRKQGLKPTGPRNHARGAIPRARLETLVAQDLSVREIAVELDRSYTTIRYWLQRYGLKTSHRARRSGGSLVRVESICERHGLCPHVISGDGRKHCARCRSDAVTRYRQEAKRRLVDEFGGACLACGYDRCIGALQFHHREPDEKRFGLGSRGLARPMEVLREEAAKCVLLCANCHVEVEAGVLTLPD